MDRAEQLLEGARGMGGFGDPIGGELNLFGPLRVGDVAEGPHPSDALPGDPLRLGEALVDAAVLEGQDVEAGRVRARVQLADLVQESRRVDELLQHERERLGAVLGLEDRVGDPPRSEEHTSELQSHSDLVCRLLLEKKKKRKQTKKIYTQTRDSDRCVAV